MEYRGVIQWEDKRENNHKETFTDRGAFEKRLEALKKKGAAFLFAISDFEVVYDWEDYKNDNSMA